MTINIGKTIKIVFYLAIILVLSLLSIDILAAEDAADLFAKGDTKIATVTTGIKKWVIAIATIVFIASALMMRKGVMNNETFKGVAIGCVIVGLAPDIVAFLTS